MIWSTALARIFSVLVSCHVNEDCHDAAPARANLACFKAFMAAKHGFLGENIPILPPLPMLPSYFCLQSMQLDGALQPPQQRTAVSVADLFCLFIKTSN
jgi:hypothetical protein